MYRKSRIIFLLHWFGVVGLLGLIATALAADFFFSKEAIMKSFEYSFPVVHLDVSPVDQLFIAKIERRDTWDWHFWLGVLFSLSFFVFLLKKHFIKNYYSFLYVLIIIFLISSFVSGIWMYSRLYYPLESETFYFLKVFHRNFNYSLLGLVLIHIGIKIYTKYLKG